MIEANSHRSIYVTQESVLVFDLDGTLYSNDTALPEVILRDVLEVYADVTDRWPDCSGEHFIALTQKYGTVLLGLHFEYGIPIEELWTRAHAVDCSRLLSPDPNLLRLLLEHPGRRIIMSNAPRAHVESVVDALRVTEAFEKLITAEDLYPTAKPKSAAFHLLKKSIDEPFSRLVFFDDKPDVVWAARELGMGAALIGAGTEPVDGLFAPGFATLADALENLLAIEKWWMR